MKRIFVVQKRCQGCKSCEIACALEHSQSKELFLAIKESPLPKSRVIVTVDQKGELFFIRCQHCKKAPCLEVCEHQAIWRNKSGLVLVDENKCIGCWKCVEKCPFKAIFKDEIRKKVIKCNYCEGRNIPACVEACPAKAIYFCEPEEFKYVFKTIRV